MSAPRSSKTCTVCLRTFGGRGRGPGELEQPIALAWAPDGNLWVVDPGNARYTVFDPDGTPIATYRAPAPDVLYPLAVGFSAAGLLHTVALESGDLERPRAVLVEGRVGDGEDAEVRRSELPFVEWPPPFWLRGEGVVAAFGVPFVPQPAFRINRGGRLWFAATGDPWVHRWSPASGFEAKFGREFDPPAVTQAEKQEALQAEDLEELRSAGPGAVADLAALIPAVKPHLRGFFLDHEQNVWIMRTQRPVDDAPLVDIYDPTGTLVAVARVALQPLPVPRVRGGLLAGVVRDELGVESVALFRIR